MKHGHFFLLMVCIAVWGTMGCGKKGDPLAPVVPLPLPVQELSARVDEHGIVLSWAPPTEYSTEKPLELDDIRTFTIYRKTETASTNRWDFSNTVEDWQVKGKGEPIKWHKGVLRSAAEGAQILLISPKDLTLKAEEAQYLRLKLWTKNVRKGYVAFTTSQDSNWDTNQIYDFQPAVHTSFYSYQNAFGPVKLRSFLISPSTPENKYSTCEYLLDMTNIEAWTGQITQLGLLFMPQQLDALVEIGVDEIEFIDTIEQAASYYEQSPWMFLDDEEGWMMYNSSSHLFGAAGGVLYARSNGMMALISAAGQGIDPEEVEALEIRMKVTAGKRAYLVLWKDRETPLQAQPFGYFSPDMFTDIVEIPLRPGNDFSTYTVRVPASSDDSETSTSSQTFSQIGMIFSKLSQPEPRHVLIDYIAALTPALKNSRLSLLQHDIPSLETIERHVQNAMRLDDPDFDIPYTELQFERGESSDATIKLAEISPQNPEPATLEDGMFYLKDTGDFSADDDDAPIALNYGEQYTYQIDVTDRKKRSSETMGNITVELIRTPQAPQYLQAEAGDESVTLTWTPVLFTVDGKKVPSLMYYGIFRSQTAEDFPQSPLARVSAAKATYTDKNLTNGNTYYYAVQAVASTSPTRHAGERSSPVTATPVDTIPPDTPTGLVGVYTGEIVSLFWDPVKSSDFAGFNVYRSEQAAGGYEKINTTPVLQASYQDTTFELNTQYYYRVTAFDDEAPTNESSASEEARVRTFKK